MTPILSVLNMDLYIFIYSAHKGNITTIALGNYHKDEIEDHFTFSRLVKDDLMWKLDISTL